MRAPVPTDDELARRAFDFIPSDPAWPACLGELADPPARLRVAGDLPFLDRAVAVVGTRRASPDALHVARRLGRDLAEAGFVVISGGAEGIDAAAHEGALEGGGLGIAVLAGGLARPFPRRHAPLFARIAGAGAVLSEADDDAEPRPGMFLARNRLIAALARTVVVVQAPLRSGALSTAAHARRLRRPLLAVPWSLDDARGEGGVALLGEGEARACRDAGDVIRAVTGERPRRPAAQRATRAKAPPRAGSSLDSDQRAVISALGKRPSHVDELVRATGLSAARVQITLMTLTLLGLAAPDERGAFRRMA
jgi:DNA processing protein